MRNREKDPAEVALVETAVEPVDTPAAAPAIELLAPREVPLGGPIR